MGDSPTIIDSEQERRLDDLLVAVFEQEETVRHAFLEQACEGDETLLAEALDHLAAAERFGDFLERPAIEKLPHWVTGSPIAAPDGTGDPADTAAPTVFDGPGLQTGPVSTHLRTMLQDMGKGQLGGYDIVGYAGGGGMGQVYIGEDRRLGRQVAIKILPPQLAGRPGWLRRFEQEARALGTLNHPNIVTIHSIEEDAGVHFLTMELVQGQTLKGITPPTGLPLDELLRIARALASALSAAHQRGVIHRDLKPANVMVGDDGRIKILDFGIAKVSGQQQLSEDGQLIGTVPYMAPEQLRGDPVDARCDLFSLGVMLYQLSTGLHPFPASSAFRRVSAILWHEPAPLAERRSDLPEEWLAIVQRCLEKDPDDRYQSSDEVADDVRRLAERVMAEKVLTGHVTVQGAVTEIPDGAPPPPGAGRSRRWMTGTLAALTVVLVAWLMARSVAPPSPSSPSTGSTGPRSGAVRTGSTEASMAPTSPASPRTSVAVLHFNNLTDDPELVWLSSGIAELLTTDLSQASDLAVRGSGRVYQLLADLDALEGQSLSPEALQRLAREAEADVVVRGSFARLGPSLRLVFSVEDAADGHVLGAETFEGDGVESLFVLVDRMSAAVLGALGASRPTIGPQTVSEATTRSLPAWKAYAEAFTSSRQGKSDEAMVHWQEAIELDPEFAMAYAQVARMGRNLGRNEVAQAASAKAFELAERLPLHHRFDIEASYYESFWATNGQAIETYRIGLGLYPWKRAWRNNLAQRYAFFERYDEALELLSHLLDEGTDYIGTYSNAANVYAALGEYEQGYGVLTSYDQSSGWLIHFDRGYFLTEWGRFDMAAQAFDEAEQRTADPDFLAYGRWRLEVLRGVGPQAAAEAEAMVAADTPFGRWRGHLSQALNALYAGDATTALAALDLAIATSEGSDQARAHALKGEILLALGQLPAALDEAALARRHGARQWPELEAMYLAARCEEAFGRHRQADDWLATLSERWRRQPNAVEERQILTLEAYLAQRRGDPETAIDVLEKAVRLLPPRSVELSWHIVPDHVALWLSLGELHLQMGRPRQALPWLERVMDSGAEHLERPLSYVRSFQLASQALEEIGDGAQAERRRDAFLAFWPEGELSLRPSRRPPPSPPASASRDDLPSTGRSSGSPRRPRDP